jgi:hypothetical protein
MKKSKNKSYRYHAPPMLSAIPKQGTPVFAVASIVFGAIFLFILGFVTYGNLTGQAIFSTSSGTGGTSDISVLNSTCYDSDGSLPWPQQYFVKGYCKDSTTNVSKWDFCNSTSSCFEYYCNYQRRCAGINMNCANLNESNGQCSNGACVRKQGGGGGGNSSNETNETHPGMSVTYQGVLNMLNRCFVAASNLGEMNATCNQICRINGIGTCTAGFITNTDITHNDRPVPCGYPIWRSSQRLFCSCCSVPANGTAGQDEIFERCYATCLELGYTPDQCRGICWNMNIA